MITDSNDRAQLNSREEINRRGVELARHALKASQSAKTETNTGERVDTATSANE